MVNLFSPMKEFIAWALTFKIRTCLSNFGAASMKPIEVWSTHRFVNILQTSPKRCATKLVVKKKGTCKWSGEAAEEKSGIPTIIWQKGCKGVQSNQEFEVVKWLQ